MLADQLGNAAESAKAHSHRVSAPSDSARAVALGRERRRTRRATGGRAPTSTPRNRNTGSVTAGMSQSQS